MTNQVNNRTGIFFTQGVDKEASNMSEQTYDNVYGGPVCDGDGCGKWSCKLNYYHDEDKFYCEDCEIEDD